MTVNDGVKVTRRCTPYWLPTYGQTQDEITGGEAWTTGFAGHTKITRRAEVAASSRQNSDLMQTLGMGTKDRTKGIKWRDDFGLSMDRVCTGRLKWDPGEKFN